MDIKTEPGSERFIVRLRGLPWSATEGEIAEFLNVNIVGGENGIKSILTAEGRPSGEAYAELFSAEDMQTAMDKDHKMMGKRYIEVFSSTLNEMEYVLDRSGQSTTDDNAGSDTIVRLRGLPWQSTKDELVNFFQGLDIVPNGILLLKDGSGRASGEAYVEFSSPDDASQALGKHKQEIGHRYIEIFKSSRREVNEATFGGGRKQGRPSPYDRPMRGGRGGRNMGGYGGGRSGGYGGGGYGDYYEDEYDGGYGYGGGNGYGHGGNGYGQGGYDDYGDNSWYDDGGYGGGSGYDDYGGTEDELTGYVVHMRGLPFKATDDEIRQFFSPLVTTRVIREYARDGRITGEANVEFASEQDAQAAMQRDKEHLQSRYIELFYRGQGGSEGKHGGYGGGPKPLMGRNMMRGGGGGRRGAGPMRRGRGRGGYGGGRW